MKFDEEFFYEILNDVRLDNIINPYKYIIIKKVKNLLNENYSNKEIKDIFNSIDKSNFKKKLEDVTHEIKQEIDFGEDYTEKELEDIVDKKANIIFQWIND